MGNFEGGTSLILGSVFLYWLCFPINVGKHISKSLKMNHFLKHLFHILNCHPKSSPLLLVKSREEADAQFKETAEHVLKNSKNFPRPVVSEAINFMAFVLDDIRELEHAKTSYEPR